MKELKTEYLIDNLKMRIDEHTKVCSQIYLEVDYTHFDDDNEMLETGEILVSIDIYNLENTSFEKRFYSFGLDEYNEHIGYVPDNLTFREIKLLMEIVKEVRDFYAAKSSLNSALLHKLKEEQREINESISQKESELFTVEQTIRDEIEDLEKDLQKITDEIRKLEGESHNAGNGSL